MEKKQRTKYIIADTLSAMLAWGLLFLFRKVALEHTGFSDVADVFNDSNFWLGLILVPAGWLSLYTIQGAYRNVLRRARLTELLDTLLASLIGVVAIFFLLLVDDHISTYRNYYATFLFLFGIHFTLTYIPRLIITSHTVRAVHSRQLGFPTVMIGSGPRALQTYNDLENQETYSGNLFIGYIDLPSSSQQPSPLTSIMPPLGTLDDLRKIAKEQRIEEAIVALEPDQKDRLQEILLAINSCGDIIIKITPDARDISVGAIHQHSIFHAPFIVINNRLMPEWQYSLKRIFDIIISLVAMIILSPVYLVTAIIVKATSPGPVFYAQERIGYLGRPFKMHKFRSMYVDAEQRPTHHTLRALHAQSAPRRDTAVLQRPPRHHVARRPPPRTAVLHRPDSETRTRIPTPATHQTRHNIMGTSALRLRLQRRRDGRTPPLRPSLPRQHVAHHRPQNTPLHSHHHHPGTGEVKSEK